jgi:hypothetical protein
VVSMPFWCDYLKYGTSLVLYAQLFFSMLQVRKISTGCEDGGTCGWEV